VWLSRLLLFIAILALLPLLRRILAELLAGLLGRGSRRPARCPKCGGSGWITAGGGMKKACGCGAVPPEGRGPIIDVGGGRPGGAR
jgi:hypothetical protein